MIKHIVFFKLSPTKNQQERIRDLNLMEEIFSSLGKKLTYPIEFRTGTNFTSVPHAWDFVIDSVFKNKEDLNKYQASDEHQEAIKEASSIEKTKAVIDYEF